MTIGIYSITHVASGKRYIGKSINIESRLWQHKNMLMKTVRHKDCNRHLWNAVQKYGWESFETEIVEKFDWVDEDCISAAELKWMDHFQTCDRKHGYNLRRDSSTRMVVHEETKALMAGAVAGVLNPNFGNHWTSEQKASMSADAKRRHAEGRYGDEWKRKQSEASSRTWEDLGKRQRMGVKVSRAKEKYDYDQYERDGTFMRRWSSVQEIVFENPDYKWQNIYNVCHGHKPTYRGFIWKQVLRVSDNDFDELMGDLAA